MKVAIVSVIFCLSASLPKNTGLFCYNCIQEAPAETKKPKVSSKNGDDKVDLKRKNPFILGCARELWVDDFANHWT